MLTLPSFRGLSTMGDEQPALGPLDARAYPRWPGCPGAGYRQRIHDGRVTFVAARMRPAGHGAIAAMLSQTEEFMMGYYGFLDRVPLGRDEGHPPQLWMRRHDEYGTGM
jgi:hypothetical protein